MTISTTSLARRPKDPDRTRAEILQAALEEFAQRGFDAATVRGIASRIGMSHGMIRYHYETKEKLWFAAVDFLFERMHRELRLSKEEIEQLEAGNADVFRQWLRKYVRYCARHPEHARIMVQESVAPSERLAVAMRRHLRDNHKTFLALLERLQSTGILPAGIRGESIIYIISGSCQNLFTLAPEVDYILDYDALSPDAIKAHADAVVAMLCPE